MKPIHTDDAVLILGVFYLGGAIYEGAVVFKNEVGELVAIIVEEGIVIVGTFNKERASLG